MAVTTVLRVRAEGDVRCCLRLPSSVLGSIRVSLPKHSDTTFLVPSSGHSQWVNNIFLDENRCLYKSIILINVYLYYNICTGISYSVGSIYMCSFSLFWFTLVLIVKETILLIWFMLESAPGNKPVLVVKTINLRLKICCLKKISIISLDTQITKLTEWVLYKQI